MNIEKINSNEQAEPLEKWLDIDPNILNQKKDVLSKEEAQRLREIRDYAFRVIIMKKLLEHAEDDMRYAGMTDEQVEEVEKLLAGLGPESGEAFLSIPAEIRERRYTKIVENIESGSTLENELNKLVSENLAKKLMLGYHITDSKIEKGGPQDNWHWSINGYEYDHRDDSSMAYYSLDHENLFYKRKGKYVYIVRADLGEGTTHRMDGNNQWGRAPRLSVIDFFDIAEINKQVDETIENLKKAGE